VKDLAKNTGKCKEAVSENKENKLDNGYTVINQSDCYRYILKQIIEEEVL